MIRGRCAMRAVAVFSLVCSPPLWLSYARAARAEGLARRFSRETLLYVETDDVERTLTRFRETGLGRIWYDEDMQAFLRPSMRWLGEAAEKVKDETGFDLNDLKAGLSGRAAAGLWTDFGENAAVIVVVEPPDEETGRRLVESLPGVLKRIAPSWRWEEAALDPAGVSRVAFGGGAFSFAFREGAVFAVFDRQGKVLREVVWDEERPGLPDLLAFADALSKLEGSRDLVVFNNLDALWRGLPLVAGEDDEFRKVMSVLESLGFTDSRSAAFGLAADPPGFRTRLFVQTPEPQKGLYSLLGDEPLGDGLLGAVPADSVYVWAGRLDLSRLCPIIRDALARAEVPPAAVDMAMAAATLAVGFNPETDLLGNMGDEMALALISPDAVGGIPMLGLNSLCLIAKVKDRETFGRALVKLIKMGAKYAEEFELGGGEVKLKHGDCSIRGVEVAGLVAPSCTLTDEYVVIGLYPSAVKLVIDTLGGASPSILKTPSFEEAFSRLDRAGAVALSYGAKPELTSGPAVPMASVASTGVMAGLLVPALSSARERARRTKCASNLKQVGCALHLFSTDHNERFPESLGELAANNYLRDTQGFACPSGDGGYVYASGLSAASDARCVVAFDAEGNHKGDGRNVLFVGGNVEWMTEAEFQEALARTRDLARAEGTEVRLVDTAGIEAAAAAARPPARDRLVPDEGEEILKWFTRTFPLYRLPPLDLVNRNLFPTGGVTRWTQDGLLVESFGPLPVSMGPSVLGGVGPASVVAAIAIPNLLQSRIASNETAAIAALRMYLSAQNQFHRMDFYGKGRLAYANPSDGKGFPDLYQLGGPGSDGKMLKLIDKAMAKATSPVSPRAGYYFVDVTRDSAGEEYDFAIDCGLCAVPAEYDRSGRNTFVIDVTGVVYQKDTGGKPVTRYPDVVEEGWVPVGAE